MTQAYPVSQAGVEPTGEEELLHSEPEVLRIAITIYLERTDVSGQAVVCPATLEKLFAAKGNVVVCSSNPDGRADNCVGGPRYRHRGDRLQ